MFLDPDSAAGRGAGARAATGWTGTDVLPEPYTPDTPLSEIVAALLRGLAAGTGEVDARHPAVTAAVAVLPDLVATGPVRTGEVAAIVGLSASRLTHLFSAQIGLPMRRYILWLRLMNAVHSVTRFYGHNGLMKHPLHQSAEMAAGVAPLIVLGMPVDVAAALALAVAVQLLLQHSNADYRVGPLKHVLALNEGHRFYDPHRRFSSDQLGMAAHPDYPVDYLGQLTEPFRRR
ncbi:hypothetical protein [Nocardia sp. AG03]|uniref:hypothetical protein n=1 Tax=Nocardia sp. AG03 TaxID=3025312 RepID=UPI002418B14A|nr:hypothetical protein [Nocardia sp. AG03]